MKRAGRVWIRVFPDVPVSNKPAEVRMGSVKGAPEYWVAKIKPGRILFEVDGVDGETAKEAMRLGAAKLSISTKFIARLGTLNGRSTSWQRKRQLHETTISAERPPTNSASSWRSSRRSSSTCAFSGPTGSFENTGPRARLVRRGHRPHRDRSLTEQRRKAAKA